MITNRSGDDGRRGLGFGLPTPDDLLDMAQGGLDMVRGGREMFDQRIGRPQENLRRMGRGDVRTAILTLLDEQPMHGYQLIREIQDRSGGLWRPSPGSIYPTLQMLTDEGLVTCVTVGEKKTYSLTDAGHEAAAKAPKAPWESPVAKAAEKASALPRAAMKLGQAASQFGHDATPDQVDRAVKVVEDARRQLYAILAEG